MSMLFYVAAGYVAAVVFPVPGVSRAILDMWAKIPAMIKSATTKA